MSRQAIIVVDLQNDYFSGGKFPLVGVDAAAANAARVIAAARAKGDLVVHVRHESARTDAPFFAPDSDGAAIHKSVLDRAGEPVITKNQINAFRDTDLKATLDAAGVKSVVIVGAMSHMCVDAVTRAAVDFGYEAIVVHDACATRDLEFGGVIVPASRVHAAFMAALAFAYARLVATEELLQPAAA